MQRRIALVLAVIGLFTAVYCRAAAPPLENAELASVLRRVMATHPSADAARFSTDAARAELSGSRWARFPGIELESFANGRGDNSVSASAVVELPLWTGGRVSGSIRQAEARVNAELARLDEVYLDLGMRTVQAYVDLLTLKRRVRILEESLREHRKLVHSMRRRVEQEVSPSSELRLAESRARQTQSEVLQARAAADIALLQLRELAGDETLEVAASLVYREEQHVLDAPELLRSAVRFDPQRRRLRAEADVASTEVFIRKSELLPQVGVRYVHYLADNRHIDDELGLVVRFQTDGGLSRVSAIQAARRRERAAQLAVDAASREHREAVITELTQHASAQSRVEAGREAALAAQAVTDSFLRQFAAGRRTWPEVLNAVREAVTAKLTQVDAESAAIGSYLKLMLLAGRWQPGVEESASWSG
jgi:adhesin transport system outer membrane protein